MNKVPFQKPDMKTFVFPDFRLRDLCHTRRGTKVWNFTP